MQAPHMHFSFLASEDLSTWLNLGFSSLGHWRRWLHCISVQPRSRALNSTQFWTLIAEPRTGKAREKMAEHGRDSNESQKVTTSGGPPSLPAQPTGLASSLSRLLLLLLPFFPESAHSQPQHCLNFDEKEQESKVSKHKDFSLQMFPGLCWLWPPAKKNIDDPRIITLSGDLPPFSSEVFLFCRQG